MRVEDGNYQISGPFMRTFGKQIESWHTPISNCELVGTISLSPGGLVSGSNNSMGFGRYSDQTVAQARITKKIDFSGMLIASEWFDYSIDIYPNLNHDTLTELSGDQRLLRNAIEKNAQTFQVSVVIGVNESSRIEMLSISTPNYRSSSTSGDHEINEDFRVGTIYYLN